MLTKNNYYLRMPSAFDTQAHQVQFYQKSRNLDQIMFGSAMNPTEEKVYADEAKQKKYLNKNELYTFNQMLWVIAYCIDLKQRDHRKLLYQWLEDYHTYFSQLEIFLDLFQKMHQEAKAQTTNQINISLGLEKKGEVKKTDNEMLAQNQELARIKAVDQFAKLLNTHAFEVVEHCPRLLKLLIPNQLEILSDPFKINQTAFANKDFFTQQLDSQGIKVLERTPSKFLVFQTLSHWQKKPDWKVNSNPKLNQVQKVSDPHFKKLNEAIFKDYLPNFTKLHEDEKNDLAIMFADTNLEKILHWPEPQKFTQLRTELNYKELKYPNGQDPAVRILESCAQAFVKNKIAKTTLGWGEMASIIFSKKIFNLTQEIQNAKRKKCITELVGCHVKEFNKITSKQPQWQDQAILKEIVKYWNDIQTENMGRQQVFVGAINVNIFMTKLLQAPQYEDRLFQRCDSLFGDITSELWQQLSIKKVFHLAIKSCILHVKAHLAVQLIEKINEMGFQNEQWDSLELKQLFELAHSTGEERQKFIFAFRRQILEEKEPLFFAKVLDCYKNIKAESKLKDIIEDVFFIQPGDSRQTSQEEKKIIGRMKEKIINFKPSVELKEVYENLRMEVGKCYLTLAKGAGNHMGYYLQVGHDYDQRISISDPDISTYLGQSFVAEMQTPQSPIEQSPPTTLIKPIMPAHIEHKQSTPAQSKPVVVKVPVVAAEKDIAEQTPEISYHTGRTPFSPIRGNVVVGVHASRTPFSPNPRKR